MTPLCDDLGKALAQFHKIDWTFEKAKTNIGLHSIHPYPAKFIPHIPSHLIQLFQPIVNGPVLDPFCGSGTTLVESQAKGIVSFGIDLNPIAVLISKVKTNPPHQEIGPIAVRLAAAAESLTDIASPDIPRLDHWFNPGAILALGKLTKVLREIHEPKVYDALRVALSRIVVRVSRQESDTRYAAVDSFVQEADVYRLFVESAKTLDGIFRLEHSNMFRQWAPCRVITKDILAVEPHDLPYRFGLIITSPPYPNAYEYWLYHKYRMYWLGENPIAVRKAEIGARPNYFRKNPEKPADFHRQMGHCFGLFHQVTLPNAMVCMIIGRSVIKGEFIDNSELIRSAADEYGFQHLASATRRIPKTRKAFNPTHGSINTETLLVFQRTEL